MVWKKMRRQFILQCIAVLGLGVQIARGQITVMPLSTAAADPSQDDDLGPAVPPANLAPIPAGAPDPFAGYSYDYNPGPGSPGGGLTGVGGEVLPQPWYDAAWTWQAFPRGWMYPNYLASEREARMAAEFFHERNLGWMVDTSIGGRVGLLRYGTEDLLRPEGFQLDFDAAVFPRFTLDDSRDLISQDFTAGLPLTFRRGPIETKFGYYHLSSHLGDMYIEDHPGAVRHPYTQDGVMLGVGYRPIEAFRLYAEADYAFHTFGFSKPWEFQFGIDWSTLQMTGPMGAPFFAIFGMIRQDVDYSGTLIVQTGWQWRSQTGQLLRMGFHYFNGKSLQGQFFNQFEEQIGFGTWYDF